jgi:tetratricopeptide (TPR) repeat protein
VVWASAAREITFRLEDLLDAFAPIFLPHMGMAFYQLPTGTKQQLVLQHLCDLRTPTLVALDNAETVEDERVFEFLRTLPGRSAALVAGRQAPEWGGFVVDVRAMEPDEGILFLVREIQRQRDDPTWGFEINREERGQLREVAERLDGHPLALLLAAARMRTDTLADVLQAVRENPARGELGRRFDFSYNRLIGSQQALLHRLAAFGSHVAPVFIEYACTYPELVGDDTLPGWRDDLHELCRRCFVETLPMVGVDEEGQLHELRRYRLHPVMRQYAALKAGDQAKRVYGQRMARLFLAYAQKFKKDFNALEAEHANLLAAMDRAYELGAWEVVTGFGWAICPPATGYLGVRGYWSEARRRLAQAAEAARRLGDREDEAAFVGNAAVVAQSQGDYQVARQLHEQCAEMRRQQGDQRNLAAVLHQLGMLAQATGDYDQARRLYQQSLDIEQQLGDKADGAKTLHQLGMLAQATGDYDQARRLYQQSLDIEQQLGDKAGGAKTLHQLGNLAYLQGDYDQARRLCQQSLDIAQQLGDKAGVALSVWGLGNIAQDQGNYEEAAKHWNAALATFRELGDKKNEAGVLHQLGMLAQHTGEYVQARHLYQQSLDIRQQLGDRAGVAKSLHGLANLAYLQGDYDQARRLYEQSLDIEQQLGNKAGVAQTLHQLGMLAQATGDYDQARRLYSQSLDIKQQLGDKAGVAITLAQTALLEEKEGNIEQALELIRRAESMFTELGSPEAEKARRVRERLESLKQRARG